MPVEQKHVGVYVGGQNIFFFSKTLDFLGEKEICNTLTVYYTLYKFLHVKYPQLSFFPGTPPYFYKNSLLGNVLLM